MTKITKKIQKQIDADTMRGLSGIPVDVFDLSKIKAVATAAFTSGQDVAVLVRAFALTIAKA